MMGWNDNWGAGDWVAMSGVLLFWGALIGLVVWLVVTLSRNRADRRTTGESDPDRILAARFARGEIDEAQLARHRAVLRGGAAARPLSSDAGGGDVPRAD